MDNDQNPFAPGSEFTTWESSLEQRSIILAKQLNTVIGAGMAILLILLFINSMMGAGPMSIGSLRVALLIGFCIINYFIGRAGYWRLFKILLTFCPTVIFILFPTIYGFVEEESYLYYPYFVVAVSMIPHLLFFAKRDIIIYIFSLLYFFVLLISTDMLLDFFSPEKLILRERIQSFYFLYKVSSILIFCFINFAVYYLRQVNHLFEKELDAVQKKNVRTEKLSSLGILTGGVSHQINNPLNYIASGLHIIEDSVEEGDSGIQKKSVESGIKIIQQGVTRINAIVRELNNYARKGSHEPSSFSLDELIRMCIDRMEKQFPEGTVIDQKFTLEKNVNLDYAKMNQVVLSILDNAAFALRGNTEQANRLLVIATGIELREDHRYITLSFRNTGPEIPDKYLMQIFDPFFTTKEPGEGAGLGLATAHAFVHDHGGYMEIDNIHSGVEVRVFIPESE